MRWFVVCALALAACGKKASGPPSLDVIDRSCKVDADCTLTGHLGCCDTTCGKDTGTAVNAKAWNQVNYRRDCKEECHVMCPMDPACRDEDYAVCKGGVCEKATRKTEACNAPDPLACETKDDCVMFTLGEDCCDHCGGTLMNRKAAEGARAALEGRCGNKVVNCPQLDCPAQPLDCVDKKCVKLP